MAWMKYFSAALPVLQAIDLVRCISIPDQTDQNQYGYLPPAFSAASVDSENSGVMASEKCPGHTGTAIRDFCVKRPPVSQKPVSVGMPPAAGRRRLPACCWTLSRRFSTRDFAQKVLDGTRARNWLTKWKSGIRPMDWRKTAAIAKPFVEHAHQRPSMGPEEPRYLQSPGSCPRRSDGRIPMPLQAGVADHLYPATVCGFTGYVITEQP